MNKKDWCHDEKGITLVETLAVVALLSIILIFTSSILYFAQKQLHTQIQDVEELFDVTYVSKMIITDVRKSREVPVISRNKIEVNQHVYQYIENSQTLKKNGVPISKDIAAFSVKREGNELTISLISQTNKKVETMIMIRGAD